MGLFRNLLGDHSYDNIYGQLHPEGLTAREAKKRLMSHGYNELAAKKKNSPLKIFFSQFNDFMTWVLICATAISGYMGESADAITILVIVVMNAILGFIQEYKTEKSLEALSRLASPVAKVIRDKKLIVINAREVVAGDVILIEEGDKIPADAVIASSENLECDESILTGESEPVEKHASGSIGTMKSYETKNIGKFSKSKTESTAGVHKKADDQRISNKSMLYMGCIATRGRAYARVIATGMDTEMGKIANMLQDISGGKTPLQKRLEALGHILVAGCILVCLIVTATGIMRGENAYEMFLVGVSLAVAAIPEGLPAIVTVSLALGVQRMMKKNTLVRKLPAVETLGCTNVICSDKTGTLTQNKMTVKKLYTAATNEIFDISGDGYDMSGEMKKNGRLIRTLSYDMRHMLSCAVLCNHAIISDDNKAYEKQDFFGDPTEIALMVMSAKLGYRKKELSKNYQIIKENPFDSNRKMMSVICMHDGRRIMYAKGALESILKCCSHVQQSGDIARMDNRMASMLERANTSMAEAALRVICFAYKEINLSGVDDSENNMIFIGMAGMIDPPRTEARDAILECRIAGITPVMITGDHKLTATSIARQLNLLERNSIVMTGDELDKISNRELDGIIHNIRVFARVSPAHKLRIVKAFKRKGLVVAMTGDGVNDAPAVKEADIGISMGLSGTDVTKEASSMILLDDNFATIVAAVSEGRVIYDNIRKFIRYLLACNIGEVLTMFLATLLSIPIPLLPIQILLVNLATDGLPAMALSLEPPEKDVMQRKPRQKHEHIFSDGLWAKIVLRGILIGVCTIVAFSMSLAAFEGDKTIARTVALCTLVMSQLFHVFECRSERSSVFKMGFLTNKYLVLAVLSSLAMLLCVVYLPWLQLVFKTSALGYVQWAIVLCFSGTISLITNLYWLKKN